MLRYKYGSEPRRAWKTEVTWAHTLDSAASSAYVESIKASHDLLYIHGSGKTFSGYDAHEVVLIEDLRRSTFEYRYFISLVDIYPCRVPVTRNALCTREFLARKMYVVSKHHPLTFLPAGEEQIHLLRRIDNIVAL
jgi:hypothetical protein